MAETNTSKNSPKLYHKLQASVFVNANDITPRHEKVHTLQAKLSSLNLFQNIINEKSPLGEVARVGYLSLDRNLLVTLLGPRFDVIVSSKEPAKNTDLGTLSDFITESSEILSILLSHFDLKGNRLALITERNFEELEDSEGRELYPRLFHLPSSMKDKTSKEFDWRVATRSDKNFGDSSETMNMIVTIKRGGLVITRQQPGQGPLSTEKNIINVQLDINTLVENQALRFDKSNISSFFKSASNWHNELSTEMHSLLIGE